MRGRAGRGVERDGGRDRDRVRERGQGQGGGWGQGQAQGQETGAGILFVKKHVLVVAFQYGIT